MTTNLPALDATTHVSSVSYDCTFGMTSVNGGAVVFLVPQPVRFVFSFDTGKTQPDPAVDLWDVTTDSSWFDQGAEEASIATALDGICALIATLVGVTTADIQGTVRIQRTWRISPDQTGTAAPVQMPAAPVVYAEMMSYFTAAPAGAAAGTGTAAAVTAGIG